MAPKAKGDAGALADVVPITTGEPKTLTQLAAEKLAESGLVEHAERLKIETLDAAEVAKLSPSSFRRQGALRIPYFDEHGQPTGFYRLRYLGKATGFPAQAKKIPKYHQLPDSVNEIYLAPLVDWSAILANSKVPLVITEGELKAACATAHDLPAIGLGGVDSWRSKKAKLPLLPQLAAINWEERDVVIVYDSDIATKPEVQKAARGLARALTDLGAKPRLGRIPPALDDKKVGIDDYLMAHGAEKLRTEVLDTAEAFEDAKALHAMNEEVVYVCYPSMIVVLADEELVKVRVFKMESHANRKHWDYSNPDKPKKVETADAWMEWPYRAEVKRVAYEPGQPKFVGDDYNSWKGLGVEPKPGSIAPFVALVDFVFKAASPEAKTWFWRWMAYPLQNLGVKMYSCVAVWGHVHGTGKSTLGEVLVDIYGANGHTIDNKELSGSFNGLSANRQFIFGDEVTGNGKKAKKIDPDQIKKMITQKTVTINEKFIPAYSVRDCTNYYFASNRPDAFVIEDTDRRFLVIEVVGEPAEMSFYKELKAWRANGGAAHLLDYLLKLPLVDFDPDAPPPMTQAKLDMMRETLNEEERWLLDLKADPVGVLSAASAGMAKAVADGAELLTATQLLNVFDPHGTSGVSATNMGNAAKKVGFRKAYEGEQVTTSSGPNRLWIVVKRPASPDWTKASARECGAHWNKHFGKKF